MAESVNPLVLPIKVDTSQVTTGVQSLRNRLNELRNNAQQAAQGIAQTGTSSSIATSGVAQLGNQAATTSNQLNQLSNSSTRARTTLTSLSLVAQDAPFGFIAIQNNLPALIQQFGLLRSESGSNGAAFKQLAASIAGPAGAFLAFSIFTSAITYAIKQYGSLGASFDALISKSTEFSKEILKVNKSLQEYNKNAQSVNDIRNTSIGSVENEIIKVNALSKVLTDSTSTYRQKQGALAELKKANDEYFGKLDSQKINVDALNGAVAKYTESLIKNQVAQNLASEAASTFTQFLKQNQIAVDVANKINELKKVYPGVVSEAEKYIATQERIVAQGGTGFAANAEVQRYLDLTRELGNVNTNVQSTAKSYNLLKTQADSAYKAASAFLSLNKDEKTGKGKIPVLGDIIEGTQGEGIISENIASFEKYIQAQVRINNAGIDEMVRYRREQLNALDIMPKKVEKETGTLGLSLPFGPEAQKNLQQYYNGLFEIEDIYQRFKESQMAGASEFSRLQEQIKSFEGLQSTIENNLTKPFRDFFDELLTNGKVSFDGFVQLAKDAFKRILAQAIASGLATLLANILTGGAGGAIGKLGAAKGISGILSGLGKTGSLFGSANFSGVESGPLQMAGAVNLQLRGSDLVASINRTNSTINRIG